MKRHNSDSRSQTGGNKRYRSDTYNDALAEGKFELRLLIPTRAAGAVIGKGGEYIKSVREKVIFAENKLFFDAFDLCPRRRAVLNFLYLVI